MNELEGMSKAQLLRVLEITYKNLDEMIGDEASRTLLTCCVDWSEVEGKQ